LSKISAKRQIQVSTSSFSKVNATYNFKKYLFVKFLTKVAASYAEKDDHGIGFHENRQVLAESWLKSSKTNTITYIPGSETNKLKNRNF
jgi:hypothetical protein